MSTPHDTRPASNVVPQQGGRKGRRAAQPPAAPAQPGSRRAARQAEHGRPGPETASPGRRRGALVAAGAFAVVLAGGAAAAVLLPGDGSADGTAPGSPVSRTSPVEVPDTMLGLPAVREGQGFPSDPVWVSSAKEAAGGATIVGQQYGTLSDGRYVRAVVARTDLTGALELGWAADQGQTYGAVRCTNNIKVAPNAAASVKPTMLLCWRSSADLTAYTITIEVKGTPVPKDSAALVARLWADAGGPA